MSLESIARRFFSFDRWLGAAPLGAGNINDTYRIDFETGDRKNTYLLQRLNHLIFKDPEGVTQNILAISAHLSRQDYPYRILTPVAAVDGGFLQRDEGGNFWRVFPFFDHTFAPEDLPDPEIAEEAARAYGTFARLLRDFPAENLTETIPGFHDTDRRREVFLKTLESNPAGRAGSSRAEIESMMAARPVFDEISRLKKSGALPLRVTHNDTKAGNVLFDLRTRKAVSVIDLDTVMPGTILSDFGDMVRTFVPDRREDDSGAVVLRADVLEALQRGFSEATEDFLTAGEKENLLLGAAWITGEQALRFLTDWLAGDVYYKIRYPEHNLVRARNQLALFREVNGLAG